jgi:hypothetical protein
MANVSFKFVDVDKTPKRRLHATKRSQINENYQVAYDYKNDIKKFLTDYDYYPNGLTKYLDNLEETKFDQSLINEIVL